MQRNMKQGIGINLISFALIAGVALRRTRLEEDGTFRLDAWNPEEGGWEPMRREVIVHTQGRPGGGTETTEIDSYPHPFTNVVENEREWSPKLPANVMVDVLEAQVDALQARVAELLSQAQRMSHEMNKTQRERELADAECLSLKQRERDLVDAVARANGVAKEKADECVLLRRELHDLTDANLAMDAQLVDARAALYDARKSVANASRIAKLVVEKLEKFRHTRTLGVAKAAMADAIELARGTDVPPMATERASAWGTAVTINGTSADEERENGLVALKRGVCPRGL